MKIAAVPPQTVFIFLKLGQQKSTQKYFTSIWTEKVSSPEIQKFHVDFQKNYTFPCSIYHVRYYKYI